MGVSYVVWRGQWPVNATSITSIWRGSTDNHDGTGGCSCCAVCSCLHVLWLFDSLPSSFPSFSLLHPPCPFSTNYNACCPKPWPMQVPEDEETLLGIVLNSSKASGSCHGPVKAGNVFTGLSVCRDKSVANTLQA